MGFTLPELMIALVVLGVVGAAISAGLRRQQQVFRGIAAMVAVRSDARDAAEVLAADISSASPLDTLSAARDSAVEFFSLIAAGVACDSAPGYVVRIPPDSLASGVPLTTILSPPDSGDLMLLYRGNSADSSGSPEWERHSIATVASQPAALACPASTSFTTSADGSATAYVLTLRTPVSGAVERGAPVRVLRRTRYSIYRSSDSRWYLGNRRCNSQGPPSCATIQPASGPYAPFSRDGESGFALRYFDASRSELSPASAPTQTARVGVTIQARAQEGIRLGTVAPSTYGDSVRISVALRNRG